MYSEKAYLARWLAATTKVAPYTYDLIMPKLRTSAAAAALQCCGGANGRLCGLSWSKKGQWDGTSGVGQQMAALEVILANLIKTARPPVTNSTGGTSPGNPAAGTGSSENREPYFPPTTGAKAGAGILSAVVLAVMLGTFFWISF
jgi:mannan endo-1,6-alpha-mannosidase